MKLNRLNNQASQIIKFKPDALIHLAWDNIPNFSSHSRKDFTNNGQVQRNLSKNTNSSEIALILYAIK